MATIPSACSSPRHTSSPKGSASIRRTSTLSGVSIRTPRVVSSRPFWWSASGVLTEAGAGAGAGAGREEGKIGRAHVCTPVKNEQLVCRLLLEKKKYEEIYTQI